MNIQSLTATKRAGFTTVETEISFPGLNAVGLLPVVALAAAARKITTGENSKMQFILTGFTEETGFRVFAFEATLADKSRTTHTVRADLALTRRYGIPMQELPLLCRGLLDKCNEGEYAPSMVFTEEDMRLHSRTCTDARNAAILKRKSTRRPVTTAQTGIGWRAPQPQRS